VNFVICISIVSIWLSFWIGMKFGYDRGYVDACMGRRPQL
jgi:hypothetical protein